VRGPLRAKDEMGVSMTDAGYMQKDEVQMSSTTNLKMRLDRIENLPRLDGCTGPGDKKDVKQHCTRNKHANCGVITCKLPAKCPHCRWGSTDRLGMSYVIDATTIKNCIIRYRPVHFLRTMIQLESPASTSR